MTRSQHVPHPFEFGLDVPQRCDGPVRILHTAGETAAVALEAVKEFETYKSFSGRKIKESRLEVLRAGFRSAWGNKDYATIISVANKLPEETLQEDEKLLLWYDQALTRMEADA